MDRISYSIDKIILALKQIENVLQPSWNIQGWSDVSGIFTAVSAIATMILAWLTRKTLKEMKETREEAARPYIVIDFAYKKNHRALYLIMRNTGKTIEYNVKLQADPKILGKSVKGDSTSKVDLFINRFGECIQSVVPDWEYETFIDQLKEFSENEIGCNW